MRVLVIGDSCTDEYVYGNCSRLCPEAPVPVFVPSVIKQNGGMAQNVLDNLISLGVECDLVTNGETIKKTRYVDNKTNHLFIRVDTGEENIQRVEKKFIEKSFLEQYDAVVISDYNKGFLTVKDIMEISVRHKMTFLDTKKRLGKWCDTVNWIKINEHEYKNTCNSSSREEVLTLTKNLIITLSEKGCEYDGKKFPVEEVEIKDLSGAGDTFLAGLVCNFLQTQNIEEAIVFANECASKVVQQKGVVTV